MRKFVIVLMLVGVAIGSGGGWPPTAVPAAGAAAAGAGEPAVFASPINAGCVQVTPQICRLHVDPFTIAVAPSQRLGAFQLRANGELLYDFRTDVSNPPVGNYTPSSIALDFAAVCGRIYTINLLARDSGDTNFLNAGQDENVTCPVGSYPAYLPILRR
jgi:hypothetical protein